MKRKLISLLLLVLFLFSGCSSKSSSDTSLPETASSNEAVESDSNVQSESQSDYISVEIEMHSVPTKDPVAEITITDLDTTTKIAEMVTQMLENNYVIKSPPLPPAGGTPIIVRLLNSQEVVTEFRILDEVATLKEGDEYTTWLKCDKELFSYLRELVLPKE